MSRGSFKRDINFDFDACKMEDDIRRGLRLYFTLEDYDRYRASAFWAFGHLPSPSELLSWLIDKGIL